MLTYWKTLNNSTSNLKTRIEGWSHWAPSSDILPPALPNQKKNKRHTHRVPHHHGEIIIIFQQQNPEAWILVTARGFRLVVPPSDIVVSNFWTVAGRSVSFKGRLDVGTGSENFLFVSKIPSHHFWLVTKDTLVLGMWLFASWLLKFGFVYI